jgi:tripartite-type tricarboxylate transporter receptor subunit TctC
MKQILVVILSVSAMAAAGHAAAQENCPTRPVRIVVGFPPGSNPDIVARLLGQELAEA